MKNRGYFKSPIGMMCIVEEENFIVGLDFVQDIENIDEDKERNELIERTKRQLKEYFSGRRRDFALPVKLEGTDFQVKVWKALQTIPYGETRSYGEIAKQIGNPKASRAIGNANHNNHLLLLVPCHRVIGAGGSLVGFGAGLDVKKYLLELERLQSIN